MNFVVKKVIGLGGGSTLGLIAGIAAGRRLFICPPWRESVVFDREIDSQMLAVFGIAGATIGVVFVGRRVGSLGWSAIAGLFLGAFLGDDLFKPSYVLGLPGLHLGAIVGGILGFLAGSVNEWALAKYGTASHAWRRIVLKAMMAAVGCAIAVQYLREMQVTAGVQRFHGRAEGVFVRYVYNLEGIDDHNFDELTDTLSHSFCVYSLSLYGAQITDDGLEKIGRLTTLRWLYLSCPGLTDACVPHLKRLVNLAYLSLDGTKLTFNGVLELKASLPSCEIRY